MLLVLRHVASLGFFEFWGVSHVVGQQRSYGTPNLITTGVYAYMRHPIYTFTLGSFLFSTHFSLDRLVLLAAMIAYLYVAIPIEEQKLIGLFGSKYEDYRRKVPAVIPKLV